MILLFYIAAFLLILNLLCLFEWAVSRIPVLDRAVARVIDRIVEGR